MFTVEMDHDGGEGILITTLDANAEYDDVEIHLYDDVVYLKQIDDADLVQLIQMSPQQFLDVMTAWTCREGAYQIRIMR